MARGSEQRARWVAACGGGFALLAALAWWATRVPALPPVEGNRVGIDLGGERFTVELAADPGTQYRGLSFRESIAPTGGMLFAYPRPGAMQFVMRDCLVPIDIAFLDAGGRVLALHAMQVETPKQPWETPRQYEARLPRYEGPAATQFALEVAGGRLAELGVEVGARARFDIAAVLSRFTRD